MEWRDFAWGLRKLKGGRYITRSGWNGKGMYLFIKEPDINTRGGPTLPYIMMYTAQGHLIPWLASQTDILADDWEIFGQDFDMRIVQGHG